MARRGGICQGESDEKKVKFIYLHKKNVNKSENSHIFGLEEGFGRVKQKRKKSLQNANSFFILLFGGKDAFPNGGAGTVSKLTGTFNFVFSVGVFFTKQTGSFPHHTLGVKEES